MSKDLKKTETLTISKTTYDFLLAQNRNLIKQNRQLQQELKQYRGNRTAFDFIRILNSLGNNLLDRYCGKNI